MTDLYAVLGVSPDASQAEIRNAYYERMRSDGLDRTGGPSRAAELRQAFEVLSDPARRRSYDASNGISRAAAADAQLERRESEHRRTLNPVTRLTRNLPRRWRVAIDWFVTIVGAIAIVLAIKAWVVNPYRIPSSSMEPELHCARPGAGCEARFSDRVLANRFIYRFRSPHRGEIVVFKTPPLAKTRCGAGGTFVKRLIGLPGETIQEKSGTIFVNGRKLAEPYVKPDRRDSGSEILGRTTPYHIGQGLYFMMGDNRSQSCDSREWGPVPRKNLIGPVFFVYWPPNRIGFR